MACLTTVSCATPLCVTKCGLVLYGMIDGSDVPDSWSCEQIQHTEDRVLQEFKSVSDPRYQNACPYFKDHTILVHPAPKFWSTSSNQWVVGESYCASNSLAVSNLSPQQGGLGHELAHIVDGCNNIYHEGWDVNGLNEAIEQAQNN